jgi:hypothetical protein
MDNAKRILGDVEYAGSVGECLNIKEFNGVEVVSLESYAEALVSAAHAVYKERIYTLNDYFTVKEWTTEETFKLAKN